MKMKFKRANCAFVVAFLLTIWGICQISFGTKISVNSGMGWDGTVYVSQAIQFNTLYKNEQLNQYKSNRFLPSLLVFLALKSFSIEKSVQNVLLSFEVFSLALVLLGCFFWFRISEKFQFGFWPTSLGFCFLFFNFPIFQFSHFYPAQLDVIGFISGLALLYYHIQEGYKRLIGLITVSLMGAFSWQTVTLFGFLLIAFPKENPRGGFSKNAGMLRRWGPWVMAGFFLISFLYFFFTKGWSGISEKYLHLTANTERLDPIALGLGVPFLGAFGFFYFRELFAWLDIHSLIFTLRRQIKSLVLVCVCFLVINFLYHQFSGKTGRVISAEDELFAGTVNPAKFPLLFLVALSVYFGPVILFVSIHWKECVLLLRKLGLGVILGFATSITFILNPESRAAMSLIPWIVFSAAGVIHRLDQQKKFSRRLGICLIFLTFLSSRIWLDLNSAVNYFSCFGPFFTFFQYSLFFVFCLVISIFIYLEKKEYSPFRLRVENSKKPEGG